MELLVFAFFAAVTLLGAVGVVVVNSPVRSAIFLLTSLGAVAGAFVVLWAEFIAVVQLMVYAGGVMVLFLFVIMLVDLERRDDAAAAGRIGLRPHRAQRVTGWVLAVLFGGAIVALLARLALPAAAESAVVATLRGPFAADGRVLGNTEHIGTLLYTDYLVPFEVASVLLLVAIVGAVVVARRETD
jgi:NADH-quinone oxidoreductase subunit J